MNNAILFFYGINISNIKKIENNYYFIYLNNNYGIYYYDRDQKDAYFLNLINIELLNKGLKGYEIIPTNRGELLFTYEENTYILMKIPNIENRLINYNDILNFNFPVYDNKYKKLDKSNWGISWANKIDFIEYQFNQMKTKYKIIDNYIDYYIGLWENAISFYNDNVIQNNMKYVCHKRVHTEMDLLEFLNPLEFVIDYKERDIGEYIKSFIINKNYTLKKIDNFFINISKNSIILIMSRILFPSYFFDLYEKIIIDKKDEQELLKIINKNSNMIKVLKYIFDKFSNYNIPYINWIKKSD